MHRKISILLSVVLIAVNLYIPAYATEVQDESQIVTENSVDLETSTDEESSDAEEKFEELSSEENDDALDNADIAVKTNDVYEGDGFKVYFDVTDSWSGGYNAMIKVDIRYHN